MITYLVTFENADEGTTALVYESQRGGYAVALRDDDSGQIVATIHALPTMEVACAKARWVANIK